MSLEKTTDTVQHLTEMESMLALSVCLLVCKDIKSRI